MTGNEDSAAGVVKQRLSVAARSLGVADPTEFVGGLIDRSFPLPLGDEKVRAQRAHARLRAGAAALPHRRRRRTAIRDRAARPGHVAGDAPPRGDPRDAAARRRRRSGPTRSATSTSAARSGAASRPSRGSTTERGSGRRTTATASSPRIRVLRAPSVAAERAACRARTPGGRGNGFAADPDAAVHLDRRGQGSRQPRHHVHAPRPAAPRRPRPADAADRTRAPRCPA